MEFALIAIKFKVVHSQQIKSTFQYQEFVSDNVYSFLWRFVKKPFGDYGCQNADYFGIVIGFDAPFYKVIYRHLLSNANLVDTKLFL